VSESFFGPQVAKRLHTLSDRLDPGERPEGGLGPALNLRQRLKKKGDHGDCVLESGLLNRFGV
jgi:hypothetical protein